MVEVGDRVLVESEKVGSVTRSGVVTAVDGRLITVRWDAGIPARVIDELMGHAGGHRGGDGSAIGLRYRHTSPEMEARVVAAIDVFLSSR